ncbi:MAG: SH3 domain-containing protein [Caldilinea sp. CFX5]|nr:SH3 domain-containing protein [Caldilinea sp. CFX5]
MSQDDVGLESIDSNYRTQLPSQLQAVQADYYTIVDAEEWPIAGLVILLDRRKQPVRAELHLYEELADHRNEFALRQSQQIINERYYSSEPIQLQVMQSYAWRETLKVRTSAEPIPQASDPLAFVQQYWQYILAASALLVLIALIWAVSAFFRSRADTPAASTETTSSEQSTPPAAAADAAAPAPVNAAPAQDNGLAPSRNADPNLAVGKRMRVRSGIEGVSFVSEPGPDKSKEIGHFQAGDAVNIFGGPVLLQGDRDTIVWWQVQTDDGRQGWVPANTSDWTLWEVAQ